LEKDFPDVITNEYKRSFINTFIETALKAPKDYTYLIDTFLLNTVKPKLKCNGPCFTCLESDPDYCTSCWGVGTDKSNSDIFLSRLPGRSTCLPACENGYTTNGNVINANDEPNKYYKCVECEMFCATCKGQAKPDEITKIVKSYGSSGDK
jgi:hypothetical protein